MSSPPGSSGRRRTTSRQYSAEDQALDQIAREAEARLIARRTARAEAREIRMREIEKQQKQSEEKQDHHYELAGGSNTTTGSSRHERVTKNLASRAITRTTSDESTGDDSRELKKELSELDEKYKKAMMSNAQLDNEKQTFRYEVDLLKDQYEDTQEALIEVQREHKERCKELDSERRDTKDLRVECKLLKEQLKQRDELIEEYGLVFVSDATLAESHKTNKKGAKVEKQNSIDRTIKKPVRPHSKMNGAALVSPQAADILQQTEGTLEERLQSFEAEKTQLEVQVKKLKQQLEDEKEKSALAEKYSTPKPQHKITNGPDPHVLEAQMEAQRQIQDYKFKLKKSEQDITTLEGQIVRLESQVKRFKLSSETSEKNEEDLKLEKRKLQRELRETNNTLDEVQQQNSHLQKRLDKIKSARSALAKP